MLMVWRMPHHQDNDWSGECHTNSLLTGVALVTPVLNKIRAKTKIPLPWIFCFFKPQQFLTASGAAGIRPYIDLVFVSRTVILS